MLRKWLEESDDALSNLDTWGLDKPMYKFEDLGRFYKYNGTLDPDSDVKEGKGKGKEKQKEGKKGEKAEEKAKKSKRKTRM